MSLEASGLECRTDVPIGERQILNVTQHLATHRHISATIKFNCPLNFVGENLLCFFACHFHSPLRNHPRLCCVSREVRLTAVMVSFIGESSTANDTILKEFRK